MAHHPTVEVDAVVVEAGVADEGSPLGPAGRDVTPLVLVQVLAEVTCQGAQED